MNDLPNISAIALHVVCCRLSCCLVGRALKPNSSLLHQTCERFHCKTSRSSCFTRPSFDLHMLAVLSCRNFRSRHTGAAHSSAWFRATPAENHFAKPLLDRPICCQFAFVFISARGGRGPRIQAQLNVFAPPLRSIASQSLP